MILRKNNDLLAAWYFRHVARLKLSPETLLHAAGFELFSTH